MADGWTRTTCPYCGVGCGVLAKPVPSQEGALFADIKGDPEHPANFGRLCSKGSALGETLSLDDRLLYPLIEGRRAGWDEALDLVARKFSDTIADHGPDAVAMYVSGQILTEDYYVANKFMKGLIGTANIDTNSRLCMASSVAGHKRAFGSDTVPGNYEDLEQADLVVLVGSNLAWCHPVLYQRLAAAREKRGTKVIVIDPRETVTCDIADLHLPIRPGMDVVLFNGLLAHLHATGAIDWNFIEKATNGWNTALAAAEALGLTDIAHVTGLDEARIGGFYDVFAGTSCVVTVYSQGVNQSTSGTDKVNAIINCHLATGRIGKPGMGPFSVTGQPNAMGGRETGGLANTLAAHMDLDNAEHRTIVSKFWGLGDVPDRPGLKAVDLFRAVADGRIKALWIMATNPVDSMPDADAVQSAIADCPFVVVSDVTADTDTAELASVLLPAAAWGEKDGTVTNSERRISRQRSFLGRPGEAQPDWWQIAQMARRLGGATEFGYTSPHEIFAEYAALTGTENDGTRDLDISRHTRISQVAYDELLPFQWPRPASGTSPNTRFFADGKFFTSDRRARFIPITYRPPASLPDDRFPFVLNTGRVRDQWHTMTRTAKTARLMAHVAEPFVEIHPDDARRRDLQPAGLARIWSEHGTIIVRVSITNRQQPGSLFVPIHWTDRFATSGRVDTLVPPKTDPLSGQPESKHAAVSIAPFEAAWYGFAVTAHKPIIDGYAYASRSRAGQGYRLEFAGTCPLEDIATRAESVLTGDDRVGDDPTGPLMLSYRDTATRQYRFAAFTDGVCTGLLFFAAMPVSVSRTWAAEQIGAAIAPEERLRLLAGRPGGDITDRGPIVCPCFGVGANEIMRAIAERGCSTIAAVSACTQAGTNCGSCRAEIGKLIHDSQLAKAV